MDGTFSGKWKPHICNKGLGGVFSLKNIKSRLKHQDSRPRKFKMHKYKCEALKCRHMFLVLMAEYMQDMADRAADVVKRHRERGDSGGTRSTFNKRIICDTPH